MRGARGRCGAGEGARALEADLVLRSVFETYTFPLTGLTTMLKRIVPTWAKTGGAVTCAAGSLRVDGEDVLSGSENLTVVVPVAQPARPPSAGRLNLTMRPVSGAGMPWTFAFGARQAAGIVSMPSAAQACRRAAVADEPR